MHCNSQFLFPSSGDLEERNSLVSVVKSINNIDQSHDQIYQQKQYCRAQQFIRSQQFLNLHFEQLQNELQKDKKLNQIKSNKLLGSNESLEIQKLSSLYERQMIQSITTNLKRVQLDLRIDSTSELLSINDAEQDDNTSLKGSLQRTYNEFDVNYQFQQQIDLENEKLDNFLKINDKNQPQQDRCSICLNNYNESEVQILKCKHYYHSGCIIEWLQRDKRCPLCKSTINKQIQQEEI